MEHAGKLDHDTLPVSRANTLLEHKGQWTSDREWRIAILAETGWREFNLNNNATKKKKKKKKVKRIAARRSVPSLPGFSSVEFFCRIFFAQSLLEKEFSSLLIF